MKKILAVLLAVMILFALVGCANSDQTGHKEEETKEETVEENTKESETVEDGNEEKSDTLIVYFSWSNNTETMANYIHEQIGGDIERIVPVDAYPDNYNETADLAKAQQDNDERPQFEALAYDPTTYDTVFIGYPIWWYSLPMIMETFFDTYDFTGITIVPFNTHEGSKDGGTYEMIREREPGATVLEGLPIRGRDVNDTSSKDEVREWLGKLNLE